VATTADGGAGAVRVSGAPSGGVSGAGAAADDVGSVIDFLSGAGFGRVAFLSQAGRVFGFDEQIYSAPVVSGRAECRDRAGGQVSGRSGRTFWRL